MPLPWPHACGGCLFTALQRAAIATCLHWGTNKHARLCGSCAGSLGLKTGHITCVPPVFVGCTNRGLKHNTDSLHHQNLPLAPVPCCCPCPGLQYSFGHVMGNSLMPLFLVLANHVPDGDVPTNVRVLFATGGWEAELFPALAHTMLSRNAHTLPEWLLRQQKAGVAGVCFRWVLGCLYNAR